MDDFFGFLVTVGVIVIAIYANKKKKERRSEELKKAEEERQRQASLGQNKKKHSSNDIVRRRKENERAATDINTRRLEQQKAADASRIHTSIHEKEEANEQTVVSVAGATEAEHKPEKFDFETSDLMQEVYDLIAYGYDGSDFLRRLEKENRFQSSLDATINA